MRWSRLRGGSTIATIDPKRDRRRADATSRDALERDASMAAFVARPEGQYLAFERSIYWALPRAFGFALWDRPNRGDIESLASALTVELRPECEPHVSLVDASRLEGADPQAFEVLRAYVTRNHRALSAKVTRLALVRPEAMVGAVVAGFFQVMDAPYETGVFTDARESEARVSPRSAGRVR